MPTGLTKARIRVHDCMTINDPGCRSQGKQVAAGRHRRWTPSIANVVFSNARGLIMMSSWYGRLLSLCGASLLALSSATAFAKDVSIAAISGYFAQGFGVSIVNGLKKAETDLGVKVKLIDTGNRSLDYEEQFNNVAKDGGYDLVFVMGWELVDALQKTAAAYPEYASSSSSTACSTPRTSSMPTSPRTRARSWPARSAA